MLPSFAVLVAVGVEVGSSVLVGACVVVLAGAGVSVAGRVGVDEGLAAKDGGETVRVACGAVQATANRQTTRPRIRCFLTAAPTMSLEGQPVYTFIIAQRQTICKIDSDAYENRRLRKYLW